MFYTHTHDVCAYVCVCVCVCVRARACVRACVCERERESRNTYSATQMNTERVTQSLVRYVLFMNILQFCVKANFPTVTAIGNFHHNPFMLSRWWIIPSILCPSKSIHFIPCLFLPLTVLYTFSHMCSTPNV